MQDLGRDPFHKACTQSFWCARSNVRSRLSIRRRSVSCTRLATLHKEEGQNEERVAIPSDLLVRLSAKRAGEWRCCTTFEREAAYPEGTLVIGRESAPHAEAWRRGDLLQRGLAICLAQQNLGRISTESRPRIRMQAPRSALTWTTRRASRMSAAHGALPLPFFTTLVAAKFTQACLFPLPV